MYFIYRINYTLIVYRLPKLAKTNQSGRKVVCTIFMMFYVVESNYFRLLNKDEVCKWTKTLAYSSLKMSVSKGKTAIINN